MPLLIVTPNIHTDDPVWQRLSGDFSVFGKQACTFVDSYEKALQFITYEEDVSCEGIVVVTHKANMQLKDFANSLKKSHSTVPLMVLSDETEVLLNCKAQGIMNVMPLRGMTEDIFNSVLNVAKEHADLHTSKTELEMQYNEAQQRFKDVADHFADWLWEVDKHLKLAFSSSRRRAVSGAVVGSAFTNCFLPDEKRRVEDDFAEFFADQKPFHDVEYWSFDAYGTRVCWVLSGVPIFDKMGMIVGYRGMARDISTQKSSADQLYHLENNDALTGLYNRNRFSDELGRVIRSHKRDCTDGALVLVNINRFRHMNEKFGYDVGDKLIVHVAQCIKAGLRKEDVVARLGGDEFGIILSDTSSGDAELRARLLLKDIEDHVYEGADRRIPLSACAGVASFPRHGRFADELLNATGVALDDAKQKGAGMFVSFDDQHLRQSDVSRKLEMLDFVSRCLDDEQHRVVLHYQPIVSLNGDMQERYEVLVRLLDDEGDIISPVKFIEIIEEYGLVTKLDQVVAHRALENLERWQKQGKNIGLSINISGRTLEDDNAVDTILHEVKTRPLKSGSVTFELTETTFITDLQRARKTINMFRAEGAKFALDDCGVGYASLNYIRNLDLDCIKIDGSFIRDLHRNDDDDAFVKALRDVARRMKITTVAEMVEEPETIEHLKRLGIDYAQGYYLATPSAELVDFEKVKNKLIKH